MGITGLLPFIKNSCRPANVRDFKGSTVAIDAYSWLHKGVFSCAEKIVKGEKTDGYVYYCLKQLNMLLDCGVKPIMVFDGCNLESKSLTEKKRRENREKTKQRGKEFLCEGKLKEARECFQRCVDVTPEMALEVIQACHKKKVDCIVAPYEADAQLAYLNQKGIAHIIITEDSDLVLFGCEKVLFKMDGFGGGLLYEKENLPKTFGNRAEKISFEKFRYMCILSGCDYLPSLPGIGLAKAFKFFTLTNNPDPQNVLPKLSSYLKMSNLVVSSEYKESFAKANNTFLYQLVFCPLKKSLVPLNPYPEAMNSSDVEYAGKYFSNDLAYQLAVGNISVKQLEKCKFSNTQFSTDVEPPSNAGSLWNLDGKPTKIKSPPTSNSYFKFKSNSSKECNAKKRTFEQIAKEMEQDNILCSSYSSEKSPVKKMKPNCDEIEFEEPKKPSSPAVFIPFRKTLTTNSTNVSKSFTNLRKIVRSRFFVNNDTKIENEEKKASWLDCIDDEYQIAKKTPSEASSPPCNNGIDPDSGILDDLCELSQLSDTEGKENIVSPVKNEASLEPQHEDTECNSFVDNTQFSCQSETEDNPRFSCSAASDDSGIMSSYCDKDRFSQPLPLNNLENNNDSFSVKSSPGDGLNKFRFQPVKFTKGKASMSRCRTLGLSKKQPPKSIKSLEDTLFNFRFTKSPKITLV